MKQTKFVSLELTKDAWKKLDSIAKKNGLSWEKVVKLILKCELDTVKYRVQRRKKLAKRLKTKFSRELLYKRIL
ncbi:MAG: hypothetical protein A2650_00230 [Candidatus Yanofskybacteria bacterium RIFCSPHIGHO2_01_FULL_41_53]|uniref:Ribbon-helix-helix protein CopG domain-containing protein n=1 Tax=Candidatus Yanofskybacteria bacterium RIFCSPHIGHO2_01_FULL_41_53 TaxID=1802663 RepID=A0A1F8EG95_9BACT|nr:MAG: hypothetical protein A2650_00230 [Candidatus Yanofskybacteria bacterium RIFCSPHIGHO2_01_FULL_41_53]OGN16993.1 MAG: hypothetical protein A3F48_00410 [Candidatus Yanofskybacteria bacterium RIFCSPHIGHO2_12_FULL_41_9]OGN29338.1 MAG: hypothetical protein A3H54_03185 [Candidatus Yanofskybacteria bacterium RIFCSPLOWO2_02_FULL_41_13]